MRPKANSFRTSPIILRIVLLASLLLFPVSANETSIPPPIVFTTQPQDVSAALGETATFTISAIGAPPISYQWRFNGTPIVGATNTQLVLTNITAQDFGYYKVVASNPLGTAQSTTAFLLRSPSLQVFPAIEVVIRLEPYRSYHLESSVDLSTWTAIETNVWDPAGELSRLYQARGQKVYYRARMFVPDAPLRAPRTAAALQNSLNTYTIQIAAEPNPYTLIFPTAGEYLLTQQGQTNRGAATHFLLERNTWTFNLAPQDASSGAQPTTVRMEFTSVDSGTWVFFTEGHEICFTGLLFWCQILIFSGRPECGKWYSAVPSGLGRLNSQSRH